MRKFAVVMAGVAIAGCATIVEGTDQSIAVVTPGAEDAECRLVDDAGQRYYVKATPDSIVVNRGDGPLTVTCERDGFKKTTVQFEDNLEGWTFGNILFGLIGGPIGFIVDAASGAGQQYPGELVVFMEPEKWPSEDARRQWLEEKAAYEEKLEAHEAKEKKRPPCC